MKEWSMIKPQEEWLAIPVIQANLQARQARWQAEMDNLANCKSWIEQSKQELTLLEAYYQWHHQHEV